MRAVPRSNSSSLSPFSQCSPWLPRKMSFDWFHSPTGWTCVGRLGATRSYSEPARCVASLPSTCRSSSRIWYSKPSAAWFGASLTESASETLYLTPLFAPGVTFHSHVSSKSANVSTVIRSPPFSGCPSGSFGTLLLTIFLIAPSTTTQCAVGTLSYPRPRHPLSVRPSNRSRQPAARSAAVRALGGTGPDSVPWATSASNRGTIIPSLLREVPIAPFDLPRRPPITPTVAGPDSVGLILQNTGRDGEEGSSGSGASRCTRR